MKNTDGAALPSGGENDVKGLLTGGWAQEGSWRRKAGQEGKKVVKTKSESSGKSGPTDDQDDLWNQKLMLKKAPKKNAILKKAV